MARRTNRGKKAVVYIRSDEGIPSVEDQQIQLDEWAENEGIEAIEVFVSQDEGDESGQTFKEREVLGKALNALGIHRADLLVVYQSEVITKDPIFAAVVRAVARQRSTAFVTSMNGDKLATDLDATNIISRYEEGLRQLDLTLLNTQVPGDDEFRQLVLNLRARGLSFRDIADTVNDRGYRTRTGLKWHAAQMADMCKQKTEQEQERSDAAKKERRSPMLTSKQAAQLLQEEDDEEFANFETEEAIAL